MARTWARTRSARRMISAAVLFLTAGAAQAVPPVLDRVPPEALMVVTVPSLEKLEKSVQTMATSLGLPAPEMMSVEQMMASAGVTKGVNRAGSLALLVMPGDMEQDPPPVVALVPTSNYAELLANFDVKPGGAVDQFQVNGELVFARAVDGGWAAVGPRKELIEAFTGKPGNSKAHDEAIGAPGRAVADSSDVFVLLNMPAIRPLAEEGLKDAIAEMAQAPMMAGGQAPNTEVLEWLATTFLNESRAGVFGANITSLGVGFDGSVSFLPDAQMGKALGVAGNASSLLKNLPAQPYLFAFAADLSPPSLKSFLTDVAAKMAASAPKDTPGLPNAMSQIKLTDGQAMVMGMPVGGPMAGLMTATVTFMKSSKPDELLAGIRDSLRGLNETGTMTTSYQQGAADVAGTKVDAWGVKIATDPANPQAAQGTMMLFGMGGGPNGYIAAVDGGVVQTFGKNSALMGQALAAAKTGENSLAADTMLQQVGERLPKGRFVEGFVGSKTILDTVLPFVQMMGIPLQLDMPAALPPIGFGAGGEQGNLRAGAFVPMSVIKVGADIAKSAQQVPAEPPQDEGTGQPRF